MIRTCDGTDENLVGADRRPCTCGATFDDVVKTVIYPHTEIPPRDHKEKIAAAALEAAGIPYFWRTGPPDPERPDE